MFSFALNAGGYLLLGKSEGDRGMEDLFRAGLQAAANLPLGAGQPPGGRRVPAAYGGARRPEAGRRERGPAGCRIAWPRPTRRRSCGTSTPASCWWIPRGRSATSTARRRSTWATPRAGQPEHPGHDGGDALGEAAPGHRAGPPAGRAGRGSSRAAAPRRRAAGQPDGDAGPGAAGRRQAPGHHLRGRPAHRPFRVGRPRDERREPLVASWRRRSRPCGASSRRTRRSTTRPTRSSRPPTKK